MQYGVYVAHAELYHHGIKGQKWGVRRFQNEDGSLTAKGVKRYAADADLNDKSLTNVSRIRRGEAQRKYDIAKENGDANVKQLKSNLKTAKKMEKQYAKAERGKALYDAGESIGRNRAKMAAAVGTAFLASKAMNVVMNKKLFNSMMDGTITKGQVKTMSTISALSKVALGTAAVGYAVKKHNKNSAMSRHKEYEATNRNNVENAGGQEYKDRKKMGQYKG